MNWYQIKNNITQFKSNSRSESDLIEITRDNINDLILGSYIKYIKDNKLIGGGFLIKINNIDKIVYTELILKSNIIWKLRFLKYKIFMKKPNIVKNILYDQYADEIETRKAELDKEITDKINIINLNKNKYKIHINN
jgi:hypothetical protein